EGREIRKAFVPRDQGWVLLAADYSQVELRILAHISEDSGLKEAFNRGQDIHTQTAAEVFEVDCEEVTPNLRRHAKVINFGIAYGMSAYGLARDLDIPRKEAEEYIDRYFERFSGVKEYMDQIIEQARDNNYVTTIFNRRRYLPQINSRNYHRRQFAERAAINTPIQGSAADIMKIAMINFYRALRKSEYSGRLLLQVHDELVLETPKTELEGIAGLLKTEMEQAVDLSVPLPVDLQVGDNWCNKRDFSLEGEKGD
ncbi:MAG: DNA polymerase, partial [Bacillota bacterium]